MRRGKQVWRQTEHGDELVRDQHDGRRAEQSANDCDCDDDYGTCEICGCKLSSPGDMCDDCARGYNR